MSGPMRLDTRGSHRYNVLPQFRPEKCPDYEQEPPTFSTRVFKRLSDFFSWGKEIITNKDYRPDAGYVEAAWRLVERGHQLAGTSLELPTVAVPGEYENVLEQPALAPGQPTDTALEPIMEDVPQPEFELVEQPAPRCCPTHPFYNFLATRPRGVPEELKVPPYELLPPAPEFLPPFADYPQDEFEYWLQWCYPAMTLFHQLRAIGRMTAYTEAYLRNRGDGAVDIMEFKGIMREVQDQPEPEWIRQERLVNYEAILAARKAARSVPPRVETPEFLAARAATLAEIEWFKNATANIKALVPDAAAIQKDCFPATSRITTQNDSTPDASAAAIPNDAAPTSLPDPSQPLPDAVPIVSVCEVSSPLEHSPPNSPPSAEMPLYSTMAFIEIINQVTESVEEPDVINPYDWEGARTPDVDDIDSLRPLKRTWQQMKDLERIIEATVPKGAKRSRPDPNMKFLNPATNSGQKSRWSTWCRLDDSDDGEDANDEGSQPKKRRIASTPDGHSDSSPSPEVADIDMDDTPSAPVTKPMEVVEPPSRSSTPASPPVSTPTPAPVPCPAVTPLLPSPVIYSSSSSHVGRSFTRNSYVPREPSKLQTSFTIDQDSEEETDSRQEHDSTMAHAPVPQLAESIPSQEYPPLAHALAPSASMVPVSAQEHPANAHAPAKVHLVCQEHPSTPVHAPATLARDAVTSCASTSGQQREQETVMNSKARERVASVLLEALPRYKFLVCVAPSPGAGSRFTKAWQVASSVPVHTLPAYDFVKRMASSLPTSAVSLGKQSEWICGLCQLRSPDSAVKCVVCEAPRPNGPSQASPSPASSSPSSAPSAPSPAPSAPSPPPPVSGFNWAATGLAPPSATSDWECSICFVRNNSSAQQCMACKSPKP
ncbi:hypothetical protein WOLCODRAFT_148480 [Wolfiporia cocos MD-104 SS10]|uniref:RanBP2-type domain-containing protein n=1 Tax=Wolfiporia cocos (strain MD-104) TaxID=742152 RepID=A0A2H3J9T9_WOLCO|nr:hypothetical protein WOLCODRAFT_148480 [Wolfiporia cocos MD-104 SS10]